MSAYLTTGRRVRAPRDAIMGLSGPSVQIDSVGTKVALWHNGRGVWCSVRSSNGRTKWIEIAVNPAAPPE